MGGAIIVTEIDKNNYISIHRAAELLETKIGSIHTICSLNKEGNFVKIGRKVFVKKEWVIERLKRRSLPDIYTSLLEKYGNDISIIKELINRTGCSYASAYSFVSKICLRPESAVASSKTDILYDMAGVEFRFKI